MHRPPDVRRPRQSATTGEAQFRNNRQSHFTTPPDAEKLLTRLEGVKRTGEGKWLARCPAHEDRSPSLAIKAEGDRVLVYCFVGCPLDSILGAIGLDVADLFPSRHGRDFDPTAPKTRSPRFRASELLDLAIREASICALAARALRAGVELSDGDIARLDRAVETLFALKREVSHA